VAEIPADPNAMPPVDAVPAVSLKYHWSNLKMLTTPLSNAIYFGADLVRTSGTCTLSYKVAAIYPVVQCGDAQVPAVDDKGQPIPNMTMADPSMGKPDQSACAPSEVGADHGSGLSPQVDYVCEETTLLCLPKSKFPALKKL